MYADPTIFDVMPLIILNSAVIFIYLLYLVINRKHQKFKEIRSDAHTMKFTLKIMEFWYWLTTPVFKFFIRSKMQLNTLTTIGLLLSVAAAFSFANGYIASAGWLVLLAGSMNFFEHRVGRHIHAETKSSFFYNAVLKNLADGILFLGLMVMYYDHWMFYVAFSGFLMFMMIVYTKEMGENLGVDVKIGINNNVERIAFIGAPAAIWPMIYAIFEPWFPFFEYDLGTRVGLIVILILSAQAFYTRFIKVYSSLGGRFRRH